MKNIESIFKSILLQFLLLLKRRKVNLSKISFDANSKILFIRLNRIGDALVTTPLLKVVKEKLGCRIDILADEKNSFIFNNNPHVDNIHIYYKSLSGFKEIVGLINRNKYDAIVDLHDDISTTVSFLLAFSNSPNILGLSKGNNHIYTSTIPRPDPRTTHVVDRLLVLSGLLNIKPDDNPNVVFCVKESVSNRVSQTLQKKFPSNKYLLGINISAGSAARYWGTDNFIQLNKLLSHYDIDTLTLCSTRDIKLAMAITNNKGNLFYSPSFEEFSAMVGRLDMLFTPDTSIVHIASAFKIPVFGLYVKYKTTDMIWSPYKSDFDCIITEEPTLHNISFNEVTDKFTPFLEKYIKK